MTLFYAVVFLKGRMILGCFYLRFVVTLPVTQARMVTWGVVVVSMGIVLGIKAEERKRLMVRRGLSISLTSKQPSDLKFCLLQA